MNQCVTDNQLQYITEIGLFFKKKVIGKNCGLIWVIYCHLRSITMARYVHNYMIISHLGSCDPQICYRTGILVHLGCDNNNNPKKTT